MRVIAGFIFLFLGAWLIAFFDHKAKFIEMFFDIPGLIFGMLISALVLSFLYEVLNYVFGH